MSAIPTHAELTESLGSLFVLTSPQGYAVKARLSSAPSGVPMDDDYACYQARFDLPTGIQFLQDIYRVSAPDGRAWDLFATPARPSAEGLACPCIVVHVPKPAPQQAAESPQ
ncbi:DUF6916 family protein [Paraburkholderia sp. BCC1884]|uniref:DUF6916 family protein n=1 Tax=Paraburkholderia sp. BCC1884 TaxID=2562668 RepID=UPI0011830C4B|nr:hypothetical protein [Paraburkholderia sp. BCC1884]